MIHVDDWMQPARVGRIYARWSHLICGPFDDLDELHEFAAGLGLQRRWFQQKPWPRAHYDVTASKRQAALAAGATPITWREMGLMLPRAREAWRDASGGLPCDKTPAGMPPDMEEMWAKAAVLFAAGQPSGIEVPGR
jgi:hypothetical protein